MFMLRSLTKAFRRVFRFRRRVRRTPQSDGAAVTWLYCPLRRDFVERLDAYRDGRYRDTGERPSRQHACGELVELSLESDVDNLLDVVRPGEVIP